MYLQDYVGKEIAIGLRGDFDPMILRMQQGIPAELRGKRTIAFETLRAVDALGLWVERAQDEHCLGPAVLHVLVRWSDIEDIAVVASGVLPGANEGPLPDNVVAFRGGRPLGFR